MSKKSLLELDHWSRRIWICDPDRLFSDQFGPDALFSRQKDSITSV
jgi:hypothetical protein